MSNTAPTTRSTGVLIIAAVWLLAALAAGASGRIDTLRPPAPQLLLVALTVLLLVARARRMMSTCAKRAIVTAAIVACAISLPSDARGQAKTVVLLDYHLTVPADWTPRAATSTARLAEFVVDAPVGTPGAEVVVYFFGKGQGGSVESNLVRWKGQFSTPDGSPVRELVTRDSSGAFPITLAEYSGTYARGIGAGSPDQAKPGQMLLAAIAETPRGTLFIQLFGARARIEAQRDAFAHFVRELKN
jgi:hypothetical protein